MTFSRFTFFTTCFAFGVILLGAFTRLTDAGLGCPDWPGCYGHLVLPSSQDALHFAQESFPESLLDIVKAKTEMAHRYVASLLGLCIVSLTLFSFIKRRPSRYLALGLSLLVMIQGAFGMWTVTLKLLPIVVLGHLVLGLSTLGLLWLFFLIVRNEERALAGSSQPPRAMTPLTYRLAIVCFIALIIQIMLGAWVSTNYAALACHQFPGCNVSDFFPRDFSKAFNLMGANALENPLTFMDHAARMTLHMVHRFGALILSLLLSSLCVLLFNNRSTRGLAFHIGGLLILQIALGISNVVLSLPLPIAVAHNGVAGLLVLGFISLIYAPYKKRELK